MWTSLNVDELIIDEPKKEIMEFSMIDIGPDEEGLTGEAGIHTEF